MHEPLYQKAKKRFFHYKNIKIHHGDSAAIMRDIISLCDGPIIFWLDGHYCGSQTGHGGKDTPINDELKTISKYAHQDCVVTIDDARLFVGTNDYPTIEELKTMQKDLFPKHGFINQDDIIRIVPGNVE